MIGLWRVIAGWAFVVLCQAAVIILTAARLHWWVLLGLSVLTAAGAAAGLTVAIRALGVLAIREEPE